MARKKTYTIPTIKLRRQQEGKTNYRKRLGLLKARKPRLVVRKSLKNLLVQLVQYQPAGDRILASAHSHELYKLGWKASGKNIPAAYLLGMLIAQKAKKQQIREAVLDLGLQVSSKGSRIYAVVKGAREQGLQIPVNEEILPSLDIVNGKVVVSYAQLLKKEKALYEKHFSGYLKHGCDPEQLVKIIQDIKNKIVKQ